ncbi:MAG: peptidylprolyl isomerase [Clostridiales bacterium]|nr:peptidylprolyl isomerase [Clostridiales bacterium]
MDATIELENGKKIELELYPDIAPITVANFIKLANEGYYDGLIFHRVIKDFMIQGGGYTTSFENKPADTIKGEFVLNNWYNLIPHDAGTLSMARAADYDSASGQFFIVHKDSNFLDYQYAAFGHVVNGMDIVDEIAQAPTQTIWNGMSDVPVNIPVIKTITIK